MIFEIKRSINNNLAMVSLQDLTQTLMECRYCMQQYDTTQIVGCLSDASTWHFMNCSAPAPSVDALITVDGAAEHAPNLVQILSECTKRKKSGKEQKSVIGVCLSLLCKNHNPKMTLFQRMISLILYAGHSAKKVSSILLIIIYYSYTGAGADFSRDSFQSIWSSK